MTDEEKSPAPVAERDELLESWVNMAELGTLGNLGVTLQMSGMLVCGTVIGGREYLRMLGEAMRGSTQRTDWGQAIYERLLEVSEDRQKKIEEQAGKDDREPHDFIHLRDARFFMGDGRPVTQASIWRGRLTSVDAWVLGEMYSEDEAVARGLQPAVN